MAKRKFTHLDLEKRVKILTLIIDDKNLKEIAEDLKVKSTTISREIKSKREICYTTSLLKECQNYKYCEHDRKCSDDCKDYLPFKCKRRDKSPGTCDGCKSKNNCRFTKYTYKPTIAHESYKKSLSESREGFNLSVDQLDYIGQNVCPLVKNGQSPYAALQTFKSEVNITEKTFYTYIESGLFKPYGLTVMDLRRYVGRKEFKPKKTKLKVRKDLSYLKGRTYEDYKKFIEEKGDVNIVQMDTVYNMQSGPFIQTFKFISYGFLFAVFHKEKTAKSMVEGMDLLEDVLGKEIFSTYVKAVLTDRGTEFVDAEGLEKSKFSEEKRTKVFYCDPMQSQQKGSLENNHLELRFILEKKQDLYELGLTSQEKLNIVISNINSYPKEKLNGKSAIEFTEFLAKDLYEKFIKFNITLVPPKDINLTPTALK